MAIFQFFKMADVGHLQFIVHVFWTTHNEYLVVFITMQNLAGIDEVRSFYNMHVIYNKLGLTVPLSRPQNWRF